MALKLREVDRALHDIWDEDSRRRRSYDGDSKFSVTKNETAANYLKREIYRIGRDLLANPPSNWSTADLVKKLRPGNRRKDKLGNVFHDLLMAVYDEDFPTLDRQERWKIAQELEYAHRHDVPPELLCGFIYQSGGRKELRQKLIAGHIEPAFRVEE